MFESKIDPRSDDACGEDPFGDIEGNVWLDLSRPFIEGQKIDGRESINGVDGSGDYEREPEVTVCEGVEARRRVEIVETLRRMVSIGQDIWETGDLR